MSADVRHSPGDHWNGWACTDCVMLIANGETPPDWDEDRTTRWLNRIEELSTGTVHVTLGRLPADAECEHDPRDEEHAAQCERLEFSWSWCDHCGERLAGERYAITGWLPAADEDDVSAATNDTSTMTHPNDIITVRISTRQFFRDMVADLKKAGGKFDPDTETWEVRRGDVQWAIDIGRIEEVQPTSATPSNATATKEERPMSDHRTVRPHEFFPKSGFSWRWCVVCDRKDTDPIHRVDDDDRRRTER